MKETEINEVEEKINSGIYIVRKVQKKSDVWKSFSLVSDAYDGSPKDYARCDKCLTIYKYRPHETGTTSFKRHISKCQGIKVSDQRRMRKMKISYKDLNDDSDSELTEKDMILEKIRNHEYQKVTVTDKKSTVWNDYYEIRDQNGEFMSYLMCKSCDKVFFFRLNRTGTTSLKRHTMICRRILTGIRREKDAKIPRRKIFRLIPADTKEKIMNTCFSLCSSDMLPLDMVLNEGMLEYSQVLINIGATKGFLNLSSMIPEEDQLYNQTREKAAQVFPQLIDFIMRLLANGQHVAISYDVFCDSEDRSFIGVNCHFINDWKIEELSLGCIHLLGKRNELDIHAEIIKFLRTLGFNESDIITKFTFVTSKSNNADQKSNIQPCMLEIVNATLYYVFSDFSDQHSNEYGEVYYELHDQEFAGSMQALFLSCVELETFLKSNLITYEQEFDRKWNSNFSMISNLARNEQKIIDQLTAIGKNEILNKVDFEMINIINNFLKPFKVVIDTLSKIDICTIYGVLLLKMKLDSHLEIKYNDSALLQKLKVRAEVVHKEKYKILPHHRIATLLCPKFKNLHFLKDNEKKETIKMVQQLLNKNRGVVFEPIVKISEVSCSNLKCGLIDFDEFSENAEGAQREPNKELETYLQTNFMFEKSEKHIGGIDVLNFWKEKEQTFPCLSRLAKSVLCVPSCGLFSEQLFGSQSVLNNMNANNYIMESLNSLLILSRSSCITTLT